MEWRVCFAFLVFVFSSQWKVFSAISPKDAILVHSAIVDPDEKFHVFWTFDETIITFEVQVETLGYVGFGLSPNGDMKGSDIIIGGVNDDGTVYFTDRHATGKKLPVMDESQDWRLVRGSQNSTHTTLRFWRPLETCDEDDRPLQAETARVIWAYNDGDADNEGSVTYHGRENRGSKSIFLLNPQKVLPDIPDDKLVVDFIVNEVPIPDADTTYWCEEFEIPAVDRRHHVIKFEPIIQPGNEALVHHIVLLGCYGNLTAVGRTQECYDDAMPREWFSCRTTIFAWAVGGGPFYFPEHVGYPFGYDEDPSIILLQTHYDNPQKRRGLTDSSGLRLTLSPTLRQFEAATLSTGVEIRTSHVIPPFAEKFRTDGHCTPECLTQGMEGHSPRINIFAGFLHSHLLGTGMRLRHFRNGVERRTVLEDNNYDFNFQETRMLDKEVVVQPGDHLITECDYKSTEATKVTFGGLSTNDEMCVTFLLYYPKIPLVGCDSAVKAETYAEFANVTLYPNKTVQTPGEYEGLYLSEVLQRVDWRDVSVRNRLQEFTTSFNNTVKSSCSLNLSPTSSIDIERDSTIPQITKPLPEKECVPWTDDDDDDKNPTDGACIHQMTVTILTSTCLLAYLVKFKILD